MINEVSCFRFEWIIQSSAVQKSTEHICFDLLLKFPPNMLISSGNLSWFSSEASGSNGLNKVVMVPHTSINIYHCTSAYYLDFIYCVMLAVRIVHDDLSECDRGQLGQVVVK